MTTAPFEPDPQIGRDEIAAADPGAGAPEPAPGFGVTGEEPEESAVPGQSRDEATGPAEEGGGG